MSFTPPSAIPVSHTSQVLDLDQPLDDDGLSTDAILSDPTRSALLVVLDEDQEMPPSERHERGTTSRPEGLQQCDESAAAGHIEVSVQLALTLLDETSHTAFLCEPSHSGWLRVALHP